MNILINILAVLFCLILGYIFGSIPTAVWIGKVFFHRDPRLEGSKNAGGTNAGRLFGKKIGLLVIILDMIKLIIPVWITFLMLTYIKFDGQGLCPLPSAYNRFGFNSAYIVGWPAYWLTVLGCTIGHCFPVFANFKGGKGVSCFMGTMCGTSWMLGFIPATSYLIILKITKKVSLTSMLTSMLLSFITWIWAILMMTGVIPHDLYTLPMYGPTLMPGWLFSTVVTICSLILVWRHKDNIERLKNGTERTITWMK